MTRDEFSDFNVTTTEGFEAALAAAVEAAVESDVDIRGAWEFQTAGSTHYWEVEVFELAKDHD